MADPALNPAGVTLPAPAGKPRVTFGDAKYGAEVTLSDGRTGFVTHVTRRSNRVTVLMGNRHHRVPMDQITRVDRTTSGTPPERPTP